MTEKFNVCSSNDIKQLDSPYAMVTAIPSYKVYQAFTVTNNPAFLEDHAFLNSQCYSAIYPDLKNGEYWLVATTTKTRTFTDNKSLLQSFIKLDTSNHKKLNSWINTHGLLTDSTAEPLATFQAEHKTFMNLFKLLELTFDFVGNERESRERIKIMPFNAFIKSLPIQNGKIAIPSIADSFPDISPGDFARESRLVVIIDGKYFADYAGRLTDYNKAIPPLIMEFIATEIEQRITTLKFSHTKVLPNKPDSMIQFRIFPSIMFGHLLAYIYWQLYIYVTSEMSTLKRCKNPSCGGTLFQPTTEKQIYCGNCGKNARQNVYKGRIRNAVNEWKATNSIEQSALNNDINVTTLTNELVKRGLINTREGE